jgi:hypothetical protein
MNQQEKDTALFANLVMMFHSATMQHLGKIKNPMTDKVERHLDQAQLTIDLLDILQAKTKGNLTDEEGKFLANVLRELKLNFVDEESKELAGAKEAEKKEEKP